MINKLKKKQQEGNHMSSMNIEDATEHVCLNCGTEFRGDFCPCCRQKAATRRLNLKDTFLNFFGKFTKIDQGLLHTIIELMYRPGYMVRDYIRGRRTEYTDPLLLIIILLAAEVILPNSSEELAKPFPAEMETLLTPYPFTQKIVHLIYWIFSDSQRFIIYICIISTPIVCLILRCLRVKKNLLNLSEAFHLMLYVCCVMQILQIVSNIINWIFFSGNAEVYQDTVDTILVALGFVIVMIMIRDCCSLSWVKTILFMIIFPIITVLFDNGINHVLNFIISLEAPEEVIKKIDYSVLLGT